MQRLINRCLWVSLCGHRCVFLTAGVLVSWIPTMGRAEVQASKIEQSRVKLHLETEALAAHTQRFPCYHTKYILVRTDFHYFLTRKFCIGGTFWKFYVMVIVWLWDKVVIKQCNLPLVRKKHSGCQKRTRSGGQLACELQEQPLGKVKKAIVKNMGEGGVPDFIKPFFLKSWKGFVYNFLFAGSYESCKCGHQKRGHH